ncbi:MAG: hypothetical protein ACR2LR_22115 [Hassallia sp.]
MTDLIWSDRNKNEDFPLLNPSMLKDCNDGYPVLQQPILPV